MKSFRDDLNDRMNTGWGRFVLASLTEHGSEQDTVFMEGIIEALGRDSTCHM
jgi:hypothetical protein